MASDSSSSGSSHGDENKSQQQQHQHNDADTHTQQEPKDTEPSDQTTETSSDSEKQVAPPLVQPDYSGLQVVESGLEVAGSDQSEALSAGSDPSAHLIPAYTESCPHGATTLVSPYVEQKGCYDGNGAAAPPPQVVPVEQTAAALGCCPGTHKNPQQHQHQHQHQHQYLGGHNPFDPSAGHQPPPRKRRLQIGGVRRPVFWALLGGLVLAVVVAVAVGLGVGLALRDGSDSSPTNATASATATATATTTTLPAATATATASSSTSILCPAANLTLYNVGTATDARFLVLCGRDYNSDDGAVDLGQTNTTFEGCLNDCSETQGCVAVGWGNYYGTDTCWLKSQIGAPNWSGNWYAAVLDDSG